MHVSTGFMDFVRHGRKQYFDNDNTHSLYWELVPKQIWMQIEPSNEQNVFIFGIPKIHAGIKCWSTSTPFSNNNESYVNAVVPGSGNRE